MQYKYRQYYFISIVILTIIVTPLLLLYGSGYRFNWTSKTIVSTGSLLISTQPLDVNVYINDKLIKYKTPVLINNLPADQYNIKIEKDGYFLWQKKITITNSKTSFIKNIILFKQTKPKIISSDTYNKIQIEKKELSILEENIIKEALTTPYLGFDISKNDKVLVNNQWELWYFDLQNQNPNLLIRQSEKIHKCSWISDEYIIYLEDSGLKIIELDNREKRQIINLVDMKFITDFKIDPSGKNIYFKTQTNYWQYPLID